MSDDRTQDFIALTSDIVSAFVSNNTVRMGEMPELIAAVHRSLVTAGTPKVEEPPDELKPAVAIKKSVTDDFIISLEDGRKFKSMRRYLSGLGMTPDEYRSKWGLAKDYPMVAPGYAARRSELAKASGLGAKRRKAGAPTSEVSDQVTGTPVPAAEVEAVAPAKKRGRPLKKAA